MAQFRAALEYERPDAAFPVEETFPCRLYRGDFVILPVFGGPLLFYVESVTLRPESAVAINSPYHGIVRLADAGAVRAVPPGEGQQEFKSDDP